MGSDCSGCSDDARKGESEGNMSRKHFRKLAEAISGIEDADERLRMAKLIGAVCNDCNDRFNWSTWASACGYSRI